MIYEGFASHYDGLMNDIDYDFWYEYMQKVISAHSICSDRVLELGCGTGNFTKRLVNSKHVCAIDASKDMLSVAYEKLRRYKNVRLMAADMREISVDSKFDLAVSVLDCLNYLIEDGAVEDVFAGVFDRLKVGGAFFFDMNSEYKYERVLGNNIFTAESDEAFAVWQNEYDEKNHLSYYHLNIFEKRGDLYSRIEEHHVQRAYGIDCIADALYNAGFGEVYAFDFGSLDEPKADSQRIQYLAVKTEE